MFVTISADDYTTPMLPEEFKDMLALLEITGPRVHFVTASAPILSGLSVSVSD
jgi:hypothetical protein